jgi:hypothetical protein
MANDFDCSIDYLINEAMRYYARSKNYHSAQATGGEFRGSTGPGGGGGAPGTSPPTNPPYSAPVAPNPSPSQASTSSGNLRRSAPPPPPTASGIRAPNASQPPGYVHNSQSQMPAVSGGGSMPPAGQPRRPQPPAPRSTPAPDNMPAPQTGPTLFLIFNSQKIPIEKDQFIIGRGSKTSDLAIKDGNISRKHAAVIRRNGTYYIKDLGSTNGIDYKGMRIDNKRIDEGDIFHLCDYELRFTYRS